MAKTSKQTEIDLLKRKKLDYELKKIQYEHDNKIEFFYYRNAERLKIHSGGRCGIPDCKMFRGANPKQKEVLDAFTDHEKKTFTLTGGNKLGKTTAGAVIMISCMIGYWPWDVEKKPIQDRLAKLRWVGQDWESHVKTVVVPALKFWWPKNRLVTVRKNNNGVEYFWTHKTKLGDATLELMSNKQDVDIYEGWDGTGVGYDEPPKRAIWVACSRGLAVTNGWDFFSATLLKEAWVNREVIKAKNEDGTPDRTVFNVHGEIYDNEGYGLSEEGIANFKKKLTPEEVQARIHGIPAYLSGLIYPQFNRETHLKPRFKIPTHWPVTIAIDTHPAKEQAVLFEATDPNNYKYLCDEIWMHGDGTQIADAIMRIVKKNAYRCDTALIDYSAKGDSNQTFTTYEKIDEVLSRNGINLCTYKKDEDGGIKSARTLLKGPNNTPSLSIFDDLPRVIYEIEGYMIDPKTQKTQNFDNDMMDNLYALANEDTQFSDMRSKRRTGPPPNWKVA